MNNDVKITPARQALLTELRNLHSDEASLAHMKRHLGDCGMHFKVWDPLRNAGLITAEYKSRGFVKCWWFSITERGRDVCDELNAPANP